MKINIDIFEKYGKIEVSKNETRNKTQEEF